MELKKKNLEETRTKIPRQCHNTKSKIKQFGVYNSR